MSVINNITKALDATLKNEKITLYDLNTADIENISAPGSRINGTEFVASESTFLFVVSGNEVNQNFVSNAADNKHFLVIPGPDTIVGNPGNDAIIGGDGNDRLLGGNGDDLIIGFGGDDILTGNQGRDRFSFERTARENGHDFITDYELEVDKLDFSATTESKIIVQQSDNDTQIFYDEATDENLVVTLLGVNSSDLTEADFYGVHFATDVVFI